jgi:bifunctional enzyme CysN/CysC
MSHQSELISQDILAYLKEHENKELLRFITCGSVDNGKSTLIGRLLYDSKLIYEDQLAAVTNDSKLKGTCNNEIDLALLLDGLQAEREQGITIDVAYRYFSTNKRKFIIADTPGHEQYTRNMATGASTADLAIILIDAKLGVLTQTRRHSYIVHLLGINKIIVAVNKMDTVSYSQDVFENIMADYLKFAEDIGIKEVTFIPISALKGDNVVNLSPATLWYKGESLLSLLENTPIDTGGKEEEFRLPVQYVNRPDHSFRGFCGTIASGSLKKGDDIKILPSEKTTKIKSIINAGALTEEAVAPMAVTITTEDEIDISRGNMIIHANGKTDYADCFNAMIVWMGTEPMVKNKHYNFKLASNVVSGYVDNIYHIVDVNTQEEKQAEKLHLNEIAYVKINLSEKIPYSLYEENRHTGSFIVIDRITNNTFGAGMLREKQQSKNVVWHEHCVSINERIKIKGHKPAVVWLTGLSGAGKSTIANSLEDTLNRKGIHTYLLDGDNVRHGLCKDLGFSDRDRTENIRRIGEVSKLFADAGLIVITAFISPFESDRNLVRSINNGKFIEVFVDAPLDVCEKRDPKSLYKKARKGEISNFTGINAPYEIPANPEIHLETDKYYVSELVEKIVFYLTEKGFI